MSNPAVVQNIKETLRAGRQARIKRWLPQVIMPLVGIFAFLLFWQLVASNIQTSLGQFPGPSQVAEQFNGLVDAHIQSRKKAEAFYQRQEDRNAAKLAKNPDAEVKIRPYTGKPTFFEQIFTSLYTVMTGFAIASLIAVPLGIVCGLSKTVYSAVNPLIQIFKPVSP
ncbi:MAG TPA: nitrate ABC transporter permease, partial [Pseudomonas sp.]|nr:nitrate ABC transporter permease [Pseudomonas sp.]